MVADRMPGLRDRRLYLPRMTDCGAEAVATFNLSDFRKLGEPCHAM